MIRPPRVVFLFSVFFGLLLSTTLWSSTIPPAITQYLKVQIQLSKDQELSKAELNKLSQSLKDFDPSPEFQTSMEAFVKAEGLKKQRKAFKALSNALIPLAKEKKIKGLYKAYCPMVQASWIQDREEISNPYHGSKMLRCGYAEPL